VGSAWLKKRKNGYPKGMLDLIENAGDRVIFQPEDLQDLDEVFERVLRLYPDMRVEMDEAGNISLMAPGSMESSFDSGEVFRQLANWTIRNGTGRAADSSVIYNLPNGAKMSPDASWMPNSVVDKFGKAARRTVTGIVTCPVFVAEVRSPTDRVKDQVEKCQGWIKAGALEAWFVDPIERTVHLFLPGEDTKILTAPKQVRSTVLDGFVLKCARVWGKGEMLDLIENAGDRACLPARTRYKSLGRSKTSEKHRA
jgi:Uma2 family endonuclease